MSTCTGPGPCNREAEAKGLCGTHGGQMRRTGRTWPIRAYSTSSDRRTCRECGGPHHAKGLCNPCYRRELRGTADAPVAPAKPKRKPASALPAGWHKPSPKPARPARQNNEELLNMSVLMGPDPYVDPAKRDEFVAYLRRRGAYDVLDALGLAS